MDLPSIGVLVGIALLSVGVGVRNEVGNLLIVAGSALMAVCIV